MQTFHQWVTLVDGYLWGPPMLVLLFGTHLYLTFRLRFIQRYIGLAIRLSSGCSGCSSAPWPRCRWSGIWPTP